VEVGTKMPECLDCGKVRAVLGVAPEMCLHSSCGGHRGEFNLAEASEGGMSRENHRDCEPRRIQQHNSRDFVQLLNLTQPNRLWAWEEHQGGLIGVVIGLGGMVFREGEPDDADLVWGEDSRVQRRCLAVALSLVLHNVNTQGENHARDLFRLVHEQCQASSAVKFA